MFKPLSIVLVLVLGLPMALVAQPKTKKPAIEKVASTTKQSPEEERKLFRLPPGFEAQLIAAEPDIQKPMNFAFDHRGRIWLTDTIEYPFAADPNKPGRDTVKILEDFDETGRARKITTFATGLNIPIGIIPTRDGAIVHSIPNIWKFTDTDGDGKADKKDLLYGSVGYKDTHGMVNSFTWSPDGWIYGCHGFANDSTLAAADGSSIRMQSGNTFRMKADGSRIEHYTFGQVNPFGLSWDDYGNLFSSDCHSKPIMQLLRGAYYQSFGKPHDGLGFGPEIMNHSHDSTGFSGIAFYTAEQFPPNYRNTVFIGNVVTSRINLNRMELIGSTYNAVAMDDFLYSEDPWFRPVDIKQGPDGALYVADFYNKIIGHYEVPLTHPERDRTSGRLWRIVYKGTDGKVVAKAPRLDWTKASVKELVEDLGHHSRTTRLIAARELSERSADTVVGEVKQSLATAQGSVLGLMLFVLERHGALDANTLPAAWKKIPGDDLFARTFMLRLLADRKTWTPQEETLAISALTEGAPMVRRAAAEAIGLHPSTRFLPQLLAAKDKVPANDRQLLHQIRIAFRNQFRDPAVFSATDLSKLSESDRKFVLEILLAIATPDAARLMFEHFSAPVDLRVVQHIARYLSEVELARVPTVIRPVAGDALQQAAVVKAIQNGFNQRGYKNEQILKPWVNELIRDLLKTRNKATLSSVLDLITLFKLKEQESVLPSIVRDRSAGEDVRSEALKLFTTMNLKEGVPLLAGVLTDGSENLATRVKLVNGIATVNHPEVRAELGKQFAAAPALLQLALAQALVNSDEGAKLLIDAVQQGKASATLLTEKAIATRLAGIKLPDFQKRLDALTKNLPTPDARLAEQISTRLKHYAQTKSDPAVGFKVFEKSCIACHQVNNKGAKVGPQLDGVGNRGLERIVEDILDPHRNVDQAFRASVLLLKNGQLLTGLVLREEGEQLVVVDGQGKELRVTKGEVEERRASTLSPMPANLGQQLTPEDFSHLLAFLATLQAKTPK